MAFTFDDMISFAGEAWGPLGISTARKWQVYNEQYFGGALRPIPLVITRTQPFGGRIGLCSHASQGRFINVNVPKDHACLVGDNCTLLHEMIHQFLNELEESAAHSSAGWRHEIMHLHHAITGTEIWAGRSKTVRQAGKVVRINEPADDGRVSLTQDEIARWPHSVGIELGALGT